MVFVKIEYKDEYSRGQWRTAIGTFKNLEQAKKFWGLGTDPKLYEWKIVEVREVEE